MKTKLLLQSVLTKSALVPSIMLILLTILPLARAASASELLERAIYAEETKGELKTASQLYQQIVEDPNADRNLIAQAQLRLGLCELRLGNKPQAILALERLTQQFPDKNSLLEMIDNKMPQLLGDIVKQIEQGHILEVDRSELMETAIRAIIGKLDARSAGFLRTNDMEFLSTQEVADMNLNLAQQLGGVGAVLKIDEATKDIVLYPMRNSPALKAGIKSGDHLIEINGVPLPEKKLAPTISLLRGPAGSGVAVTVSRPGVDELLPFNVTRDTIRLPSVNGDHYRADGTPEFMLDEQRKIGYIRLTQFGLQTPKEMEGALMELQARGIKGLILDLRNNPGGSLDAAIGVADLFVEDGTILTVKSRKEETVYRAKADGTFSGFPIALLVSRTTASAAEIVAACLQDHHRAVVIGERTFGQGIVRTMIPLKEAGALKLPIAAYYRPSGKNVNRYPGSRDTDDWGVKPDEGFEVAITEDELKEFERSRAAREAQSDAEVQRIEFQDRQLQKAIDYLATQLAAQ